MSAAEPDLSHPDSFADGFPHAFFRELRAQAPVHWQQGDVFGGPGFWVLSRYEEVRFVSKRPELFSSHFGVNIETPRPGELDTARSMITMDPPAHARYRKLVARVFTPRQIAAQEGHARAIVTALLDRVGPKGSCDFVTEVAAELPLQVIAEFLGVPAEDRRKVFDWSNRLLGSEDPEYAASRAHAMVAAIEMFQFAYKLSEARLAEPRRDLVSDLIRSEVGGEKLSLLEFGSFFLLLAIAGNETTRNLISHGLLELMRWPEQRAALLADPALLPGAIEEMLRYTPPVMYFRRTATQDVELRGQRIRQGDKLTVWYPSANRDEDVFPDPDRFDVRRSPNEHLAFGVGEHFCLGAALARLEIRVLFEELLARLPDIELDGPVRKLRSHFIDGIKSMPVRFSPEAA
jgi:cytochrome P450